VTVYAITSLTFAQASRPARRTHPGHWAIENGLHWVRDVTWFSVRFMRISLQGLSAIPLVGYPG
jgi:hypothetical protein